jgi:hypothetical protein
MSSSGGRGTGVAVGGGAEKVRERSPCVSIETSESRPEKARSKPIGRGLIRAAQGTGKRAITANRIGRRRDELMLKSARSNPIRWETLWAGREVDVTGRSEDEQGRESSGFRAIEANSQAVCNI